MEGAPPKSRLWFVRYVLQLGALTLVLALLGLLLWKIAVEESGASLVADVRSGKSPAGDGVFLVAHDALGPLDVEQRSLAARLLVARRRVSPSPAPNARERVSFLSSSVNSELGRYSAGAPVSGCDDHVG